VRIRPPRSRPFRMNRRIGFARKSQLAAQRLHRLDKLVLDGRVMKSLPPPPPPPREGMFGLLDLRGGTKTSAAEALNCENVRPSHLPSPETNCPRKQILA